MYKEVLKGHYSKNTTKFKILNQSVKLINRFEIRLSYYCLKT